VARPLSTALVLTLLAATTVAFAVSERLKLTHSPVTKVVVTKLFSPTCECPNTVANISFRLRRAGRMTLAVVDAGDRSVRTLLGPQAERKGPVTATWDGRSDDGAIVADGAYRPRVRLGYRTIVIPARMRVDTTAPIVRLVSVRPRVLGRRRSIQVRYRLSEPAQVSVFLKGKLRLLGHSTQEVWKLQWQPRLPPGRYRLTVTARDLAGNVSNVSRGVTIVSPFVLLTKSVHAVAGSRLAVRLRSDGRPYRWRLGPRGGTARARTLRLTAPQTAGRYRLVITQDGVRRVVVVRVTARPKPKRKG
jgi:flagellar hook capping protein FlgD